MPEYKNYTAHFPGAEEYYWADDGTAITLVYTELAGGEWIAWNPLDGCENIPVSHFVAWSHRLVAPMPDDENA